MKELIAANELRIGNLYNDNGVFKKASPSTIEEVWNAPRSWCKAIPLTEEWLLRFGLDYTSEKDYYYLTFTIKDLLFETSSSIEGFTYNLSFGNQINIQHVHSLQNLYFALTGEELTTNNK